MEQPESSMGILGMHQYRDDKVCLAWICLVFFSVLDLDHLLVSGVCILKENMDISKI